jgi:diacylglycerol kinase (ATP)
MVRLDQKWAVRTCVIFNPSAKGEQAKAFHRQLDGIAAESTIKLTSGPGDGRRLATQAVTEGFQTIVAAGGDGTVNEVLNGVGDAPNGFELACLGVLPLGTVNVFARELAIPARADKAWEVVRQGRERRIDLPSVSFLNNGTRSRRYFAQLAGAGLDARAVELVAWEMKKRIGVAAYILAGLQAIAGTPARITATAGVQRREGGLVLIGNGRLYGGSFRIFPRADLRDGLLEVCVFPRVNWFTLVRCGPRLLLRGDLPGSAVQTFQTSSLELTSAERVPFEIDGELVGDLPATFSVETRRLRVIVPSTAEGNPARAVPVSPPAVQ